MTSLTERNSGTTQKLPFGANSTTELQNVTTTPDNTGTIVSRNTNTPRYVPVLSNGAGTFLSSVVVLAANWQI
jgi:spore coat protein U-like protein